MAEKVNLEELDSLAVVDANDLILGYSKSGKKFGFIPVSVVTNGGYACRRWDMTSSSPTGEAYGNIDYLRELPTMLGLGCYLVDKNHGRRKLDPTDHYKFATGETAALDGTMGDYMWGWGTKWYYAWWVEGDYYYEAASLKPIPGRENYVIPVASTSALGVSVIDRDNLELVSVINKAAQYRGGNNDATLDDAFNTQLGRAATNLPAQTFADYARKKGDGWEAYWYTFPAVIGILFRIIFGTRNVQASYNANKDSNGLYQGGLGIGVTDVGSWWSDNYKYYGFLDTDVAVSMGDSCGVCKATVVTDSAGGTATVNVPVFFGLKNSYGYLNRLERGRLFNKTALESLDVYVASKMYAACDMTLTGKTKVGTATVKNSGIYIKTLSMQNLAHYSTADGASSSTYYCDRAYTDTATSGLRVPLVGGRASSTSSAGLECCYASIGVAYAYASCGSPLCESEEDWETTPVLVDTAV